MGPMSFGTYTVTGAKVDHPNFNGGAFFDPINGPWDIDNDGDGIADSIWMDLGYPVQSTADGRLYKPLFAILCIDLDGRLNVNAHGTSEQIETTNDSFKHTDTIQGPWAGTAGGTTAMALPRGQGYGPAEIDLTAAGLSVSEVTQLLRGGAVGGQTFDGRYGEYGQPTAPQAGMTMDPQSHTVDKTEALNTLALIKRFQFPTPDYTIACSFKSPSDLWGRMAVGIDYNGQPYYAMPKVWGTASGNNSNMWQNETWHCPYDINLSRDSRSPGKATGTKTSDNPFTVFELEKLLRPNDIDTTDLPQRLWQLTGAAGANGNNLTFRTARANNRCLGHTGPELCVSTVSAPAGHQHYRPAGGGAIFIASHHRMA